MNASAVVRFWEKVDRRGPDDCWEWIGGSTEDGYGRFYLDASRNAPVRTTAHRVAYELSHGAIPNGLSILHRCDNPPCCNPSHLFPGTKADNNADRDTKRRGVVPRLPRGEAHPQAKLTDHAVRTIRERYARGGVLQRQLAADFGVDQSTISVVVRGRSRAACGL